MYGASSAQGLRPQMEDLYIAQPHWTEMRGLYAVFDGHSGIGAANLCRERLPNMLVSSNDSSVTCLTITACFRTLDNMIKEEKVGGGTTATTCIVDRKWVVLGNTGDSRSIIGDVAGDVIASTNDHKPVGDEFLRVWNSGGYVLSTSGLPRVGGELAMSRALGSKLQGVIPDPEFVVHTRTDQDAYVLMASDGVWDVMSNEEAANIVHVALKGGHGCGNASRLVISTALRKGGCDNVTAVVVDLRTT